MEKPKKQSDALTIQKCFDTPDGKLALKLLEKFCGPDIVRIPTDSMGRIDPLEVMLQEGKRAVMVHIRTLLNKDIHKERQEYANE